MDNWSSNLVPKISLLPSHPRAMLREKERSWEPGLFALVLVESGSFRFCCRSVPRRPTYVEKNFPRLHISFSVNSVMSLKLFFLPNIRFCSFCSIRSIKWSIHQYIFQEFNLKKMMQWNTAWEFVNFKKFEEIDWWLDHRCLVYLTWIEGGRDFLTCSIGEPEIQSLFVDRNFKTDQL